MLIFLAMATGLFIPWMEIPRLALAAHLAGLMGGLLLIAIGVVWPHFHLTQFQQKVMVGGWTYVCYANWGGTLLGAILGTGRITPIASSGTLGSVVAERLTMFLLISMGTVSILTGVLSIWGLRSVHPATVSKRVPHEAAGSLGGAVAAGSRVTRRDGLRSAKRKRFRAAIRDSIGDAFNFLGRPS